MRILSWFSNGAASAVATKKALEAYGDCVVPVTCDTRASEHPDNYRFSSDCERWFGKPIIYLRNEKYSTVDEVFEKTRYMAGINGARCTTELKKIPRLEFASPDDIHIFGFTADEPDRISDFAARNPELLLKWPLQELGITKSDCYEELLKAGIKMPAMYLLKFDNNNCPGCVKATGAWYWDNVRKHFPDVFERRCAQSRKLGVRLVQLNGERIFLDELPPGPYKKVRENLSCGPECGVPQQKLDFGTKLSAV